VNTSENPEAAISRMLACYDIGGKLRRLRLRKKIALVELGKHTGLSPSMLSQLENGKLIPTLPTLSRIAMVFDVSLEHFFDRQGAQRVFALSRSSERIRFPERADTPNPSFFFEVLAHSAVEKRLSAYLAEFPVRAVEDIRDHHHEGWEFLHVISGDLVVRYQSEDNVLSAGDCVYFDAVEPHSYRGQSDPAAQALVITIHS
jgi:transcriptional regulator with XRE-family HTH domain